MNKKPNMKNDNDMDKKIVIFILVIVITTFIFSALLPYPVFSNYTNITAQNMYDITNAKELSENSENSENEIAVLTLDWSDVDSLLEVGKVYEIIDARNGFKFQAKRIGGRNHADIEPIDVASVKELKKIYQNNLSWDRKPVYVKLTDYVYLSASICGYPHGNFEIDNGLDGHICLHFLNSKADNTNKIDLRHQLCIKYAKNHSKNIYELIA